MITTLAISMLINTAVFAKTSTANSTDKQINRPEIVRGADYYAYVNVRSYYRSNGTYVAPHIRTNPDGYRWNNFSSSNETASKNDKYAYVHVRGYYRSNGTYVNPHIRSYPDGIKWNNLSSFNETKHSNTIYNPDSQKIFSQLV